jgi:hypothetical protein
LDPSPVWFTPLHHKPIVYGSVTANALFWALVVLHVVPGLIAPISAIVAFATKKGGKLHLASGRWFVRSMAGVALTGIVLDLIRLTAYVDENHTKYTSAAMPSSYPARLGFLYAAMCILYMLREAAPPNVFRWAKAAPDWLAVWAPRVLVATAAAFVALIAVRYNPWTGALWMVVTFGVLAAFVGRARAKIGDRAGSVAHHRFGMAFLAAFSWWGALQGFGPGIAVALRGVDRSVTPYVGDRPGPFSLAIVFFLVGWAPLFLVGAALVRRFRLRAARAAAPR